MLVDYEEQWTAERGVEQLHLTLRHMCNLKHTIHNYTYAYLKYVNAFVNAYYKPAGNFCRYHAEREQIKDRVALIDALLGIGHDVVG